MNSRFCLLVLLGLFSGSSARADEPLLTVAELSEFKKTSRHAEVVDYCEHLAKLSPLVKLAELGTTTEGKKLPLLIIADPPISTPEEAAKSGKLVVFVIGNIHAGEVDGKEAMLMLARDLVTAKDRAAAQGTDLAVQPDLQCRRQRQDGEDQPPRPDRTRRGMGVRPNSQGFDLNRDFIKLESPEDRAIARLMTRWDPVILVDMHTTNGSHHRYVITYDGPRNPATDPRVIAAVADKLLPEAGKFLEQRTGFKTFTYGNFNRAHTAWEPYPAEPRYSTQYIGLRNRFAVLVESYSYATYKDRIIGSRDFLHGLLQSLATNKDEYRKVLADARSATIEAGRNPQAKDTLALRHKLSALPGRTNVLGYVEEEKNGRRVATDKPQDYAVEFFGRTESTLNVPRAYAYLFPASFTKAVETLQHHGIEVEELATPAELNVEVYKADKVMPAQRPFQGHRTVTVEATPRKETRKFPVGTILVRSAQPLGSLAGYVLEPQAEDGLCTWNLFDEGLKEGQDVPMIRVPAHSDDQGEEVATYRELGT